MKTLKLKKLLTFFLLAALPLSGYSQQEEYTVFLEQALEAAEKVDEKNFFINLRYFSAALERDEINPEILNEQNLKLYTEALYLGLFRGRFDLDEKDTELALKLINYDIENRPDNMVLLALLYRYGSGVPQDETKAIFWLEKAVEKENAKAMNYLGVISKDTQKQIYWFERAAEKGHMDAINNLGRLYEKEQDFQKAIFWREKAVAMGDTIGMVSLGSMYLYQEAIQDYQKAIYWYEMAAEKGNSSAINNLGYMYEHGQGVKKDSQKALFWYKKGCDSGDYTSCKNYEYLTDELNENSN